MRFAGLARHRAAVAAPTRVLIIDDSAVARAALSRIVSSSDHFVLVDAVESAARAIAWLRKSRADILLLDIQMPDVDGLSALPELLAVSAGARVLIVSTLAEAGARSTMRALALGATDTLAKPQIGGIGQGFAAQLLEKMQRLGASGSPGADTLSEIEPAIRRAPSGPVACLAIGASTGGLHALDRFFAALPIAFQAPILVTQHLPPPFIPFFVDQLATMSGRPTAVARDGAILRTGEILVAPGTAHLALQGTRGRVRVTLRNDEVETRCRPSVDPMFESVAKVFGESALAVVLTGMGRDGATGAKCIIDAGGTVIAQDPGSSAVWGMPGTVIRAGAASVVGPPDTLATYVGRRGWQL